jgi:hypothetical protein
VATECHIARRSALTRFPPPARYAIQWVTIERLPRLPFSTVLDSVAQCVVSSLIFTVTGACLAYRAGRPQGGCGITECEEFNTNAAEKVDILFASAVSVFVIGYCFVYLVCVKAKRISRAHGWARPWITGTKLGNKWFKPKEGQAYRLYTDEAWADKHENKFMGEGTPVSAEEW